MKAAIGETERRRARQLAFQRGQRHHAEVRDKAHQDIIDGVWRCVVGARRGRWPRPPPTMPRWTKGLAKTIRQLEKEMLEHARNLEFEKAAAARDKLFRLRQQAFGADTHDVPRPTRCLKGAVQIGADSCTPGSARRPLKLKAGGGTDNENTVCLYRQHLPVADRGGLRGAGSPCPASRDRWPSSRGIRVIMGRVARSAQPDAAMRRGYDLSRLGRTRSSKGILPNSICPAMDRDHFHYPARQGAGGHRHRVRMFLSFRAAGPSRDDVPDPYCGDQGSTRCSTCARRPSRACSTRSGRRWERRRRSAV